MLPKFCIYTQYFRDRVEGGNDQREISRWYGAMGPHFHSMHHYCFGLMKINRALILAKDQRTRQFYLSDAVSEFDFVLRGAPDEFVMLPEVLMKKGETLLRIGQVAAGLEALEKAIAIRPEFWPPYARISDHHVANGNLAKAREVLEAALSIAPDAPGLKSRLASLEKEEAKRRGSERP
jgi:tetratricopeptide (TPR) repeat protein